MYERNPRRLLGWRLVYVAGDGRHFTCIVTAQGRVEGNLDSVGGVASGEGESDPCAALLDAEAGTVTLVDDG
jgi:hypothetical protein